MFSSVPSNLFEMRRNSDISYEILPEAAMFVENGNTNSQIRAINIAEAKAAASNSRKEAERRRRKRINGHIATLKSILPNAIKTDKASLLGEAVRRVPELKKEAEELAAIDEESTNDNISSKTSILKEFMIFPSERDELKISHFNEESDDSGLIDATLCCEDRPEIVEELIRALKSVEAKVVRAEMSTVGGRTKSLLWLRLNGVRSETDVGLEMLRRALKMVVDKPALSAGSGQALPGNKRPRCYHL